jgi:signal transduction histidine kinase
VTLDFELLVLDLDDSPRHITFLSDEQGNLLVHPGAGRKAGARRVGPSRMQDLFPSLAECYLPGRPPAEDEELAQSGRLLAVPPEEFARAFSPGEGRYFLVFRLGDTPRYRHARSADRGRLLAVLEEERRRAEQGAGSAGARLNYSHSSRGMPPRPEIGRHTTRLVVSGLSRDDLERVRQRLQREFGLEASAPRPARHFALHFYKVFFDPSRPDRFLGLAWAASTEEIKADFDAEVSAIQWWIVGVIVFALLLVPLFSVMITQPLRRLTQVTAHIAEGVFEDRSLEEAEQAPDEIGRLAGSFRQMVEQLRERSEALRRLNEELEARVAERTAELNQANSELAAARDHAFAASRAKSAFLASMSHELRTPLNAIIGYSEMLAEEAAEAGLDGFKADLEKICSSGRHLLAIINDILDHSKIEAGRVQLVLEDFAVGPLLEEVAATLRVLARRHGNTISVQYAPNIGQMRADLTRVRQVLFNLLSNACKFTEQGQISLSAAREASNGQEWISFSVSDTGMGMSSQQVAGLFQEFAQLDNTIRRRFEGTGLGLAISKRLAELMGGTISVESEPGRGSTFLVRLPAVVRLPQPLRSERELQQNQGPAPQDAFAPAHPAGAPGASTAPGPWQAADRREPAPTGDGPAAPAATANPPDPRAQHAPPPPQAPANQESGLARG